MDAPVRVVPTHDLAERYASTEMLHIWNARERVILERQLWLTILELQRELGLRIDGKPLRIEPIDDYYRVVQNVDLDSIRARERVLRHDVKARIEEFNALAGHELIHLGMTSRDATDNTEQIVLLRAMKLVRDRAVAVLVRMSLQAEQYSNQPLVARTHNVPAQVTTLGKRFAMFGEELLNAFNAFELLIQNYPFRGMKGAVGTQTDMLSLLGSEKAVEELERRIAVMLGFNNTLKNVGQVYPRSMDYEVLSALVRLASGPANLALTMRHMAGNETFTEGFKPGQVGSSAMPHKMNTPACERIDGLMVILQGLATTASSLTGRQWNEGDVSCSVVRRFILPSAFYAIDGMFQTILNILDGCGVYPAVLERELDRYFPFLSTSRIMMAAVQAGMGRETAHEVIKKHAVAAALRMRETGATDNDLLQRLAEDASLPLSQEQLTALLAQPLELAGNADTQVNTFIGQVAVIVDRYPEAAFYNPEPIL